MNIGFYMASVYAKVGGAAVHAPVGVLAYGEEEAANLAAAAFAGVHPGGDSIRVAAVLVSDDERVVHAVAPCLVTRVRRPA